MLSIGGSGAQADTFSAVAASEEARRNLVNSSRVFLETYNFDGIDVDWEKPYAKDKVRTESLKFFILFSEKLLDMRLILIF